MGTEQPIQDVNAESSAPLKAGDPALAAALRACAEAALVTYRDRIARNAPAFVAGLFERRANLLQSVAHAVAHELVNHPQDTDAVANDAVEKVRWTLARRAPDKEAASIWISDQAPFLCDVGEAIAALITQTHPGFRCLALLAGGKTEVVEVCYAPRVRVPWPRTNPPFVDEWSVTIERRVLLPRWQPRWCRDLGASARAATKQRRLQRAAKLTAEQQMEALVDSLAAQLNGEGPSWLTLWNQPAGSGGAS